MPKANPTTKGIEEKIGQAYQAGGVPLPSKTHSCKPPERERELQSPPPFSATELL